MTFVFPDPAVEHEAHGGLGRAVGVVGEDRELNLNGSAPGVGCFDDNLAQGGVFGPGTVDVFEVIGALVAGVVAATVEEVFAVGGGLPVLGDEGFPRGVGFRLIAFFPGDEVDEWIC